jgi:hypothetical protein
MWLRFVDGRPLSGITTQFLEWYSRELCALGKKVWVLVWDNASWHTSKEVRRTWVSEHNRRRVKKGTAQGVKDHRLLVGQEDPMAQPDRAQVGTRQA